MESLSIVNLSPLFIDKLILSDFWRLYSVILGLKLVVLNGCTGLNWTPFLRHTLLRHICGAWLIGWLCYLVTIWDQPPLTLRGDVLPTVRTHRSLWVPRVVGAWLERHRLRGLDRVLWLASVRRKLAWVQARIYCLPGHVESPSCVVLGLLLTVGVSVVARG